jgi:hypothetical protein
MRSKPSKPPKPSPKPAKKPRKPLDWCSSHTATVVPKPMDFQQTLTPSRNRPFPVR